MSGRRSENDHYDNMSRKIHRARTLGNEPGAVNRFFGYGTLVAVKVPMGSPWAKPLK